MSLSIRSRRRRSASSDSRDFREIIATSRGEMTCEFYQKIGPIPTMQAVDAMPPEYRALVHEFGIDVWQYWKKGYSVDAVRKQLARG